MIADILTLLQQVSLFLLVAYLFSKSSVFKSLAGSTLLVNHKLILFVIFCAFSITGTYIGLPLETKLLNISVIGIVIAGLAGGLWPGLGVGAVTGMYLLVTDQSAEAAMVYGVVAVIQGGLAGGIHVYFNQRNQSDQLFSPAVTLIIVLCCELLGVSILSVVSGFVDEKWFSINIVFLPMVVINCLGATLFMTMMRDQKIMQDKVGAIFSAKALNIAERSLGILSQGFNAETAQKLAKIIYDETGVGAVGISDCEKILAFIGIGADHHLIGLRIASPLTQESIRENKVIYADGVKEHFTCALSSNCPLGSSLVVPLRVDNEVVGTIKLYEPKNKLFLSLNKTLGEGIAKLLSEQLLRDRYENQKNLLVKSELKLIQAQVNPHFLFNALNTIVAVVRKDPDQARNLLLHLSNYFRKNLKRSGDLATLEEELDHVNSYLYIQKVRFGEKLQVFQNIDSRLLKVKVPTFTLQPIVENAVKHGISNMLENGVVKISARSEQDKMLIEVTDDAGAYCDKLHGDGLGMNIVEKRIQNLYGQQYGTKIFCTPGEITKVTLILPCQHEEP